MSVDMKKLGGLIGLAGIAGLGVGILSAQGCDQVAKQCGLECPADGVAEGNFSITGNLSVDGFFKSVVDFKTVATNVAADIKAELGAIQAGFGLTNAEVEAAGSLGAAIQGKLDADFKASITVDAQPAKCEVNAKLAIEAQADCAVKAGCEVDAGELAVECSGTCTVEANVEGGCEANAEVVCQISGPEVSCEGTCEGTCTVAVEAGGSCEGRCNGECTGSTDAGGKCDGECKGSCELSGSAAAECSGSCNGSCSYKPAEASCQAGATVECQLKAEAKAECTGRCDGEFTPPSVNCEASASCEASAKADAEFNVECTPPSISVDVVVDASVSAEAEAQLKAAVGVLKVRLPKVLAALKKSETILDAGAKLGKAGATAVEGTLSGLADGDIDVVAAYRIGTCALPELKASASAIASSGKGLEAQVSEVKSLSSAIGMN